MIRVSFVRDIGDTMTQDKTLRKWWRGITAIGSAIPVIGSLILEISGS